MCLLQDFDCLVQDIVCSAIWFCNGMFFHPSRKHHIHHGCCLWWSKFCSCWIQTTAWCQTFLAVYLTFRRSAFYAVAYAANDAVLIFLWVLASLSNTVYISVVICFVIFLANDIYGFYAWSKMQKRQINESERKENWNVLVTAFLCLKKLRVFLLEIYYI